MINSIKIKKLFGRFDYELKFLPENIMIITGPNGFGKSTILKMINSFCSNNMQKLFNYAFNKFAIDCDDCHIEITKNENDFKINGYSFFYPNERLIHRRGVPPFFRRVGYDEYMDLRTNEIIKMNGRDSFIEKQITEFHGDRFFELLFISSVFEEKKDNNEKCRKLKEAYKLVQAVRDNIGKIQFIQEQRLIERRRISEEEINYNSENREKYVTVINENSEKLKSALAEIMKNHSSLASELDSTYIRRLLDADISSSHNIESILSSLNELRDKQQKLQKYALAEIKDVSYISTRDKSNLQKYIVELSIYLQDANEKYDIFEDIINKLDLYEKIVNHKLAFKTMRLSRTEGIQVISNEGALLSLNDLSSGEQEILVLFFKLIFESNVNLLMIDEPEISLHIAWQKELMDDLRSVIRLNKNIQVIIATHSPQIISNNWDLQIDLGEQYHG